TWTKDERARWPNTVFGRHPFQMGAFAADPDGTWVYLFGTRNGRYGPVHLARVRPSEVGDPARYQYWTGHEWTTRARAARPVLACPCGDLSVAFHAGLGAWPMLHLHDANGRILLRVARQATGPWSAGQTLVDAAEYPGLCGGYLHPGALAGRDIFFTVSQ